ncbi:two-component sensor histidine kinase [Ideonella sp. 4Y16]|uniref:sensor histidine kinase n=1 Tax=Ideonella alba TaxID=2824118 RepID=UPI001B35E766|nr:ATP-binding protein [Ideonella alba]MBQ0942946.1 two-component sensor histidine kinase [Ideonella alba]
MKSIRLRLLAALLAALAAAALAMAALTYRAVLAETESLFDYQLQQMALSLRDQGQVAPEQAEALADTQLDFVVQIWSVDGRAIYASRRHTDLPGRAALGLADVDTGAQTWRSYAVLAQGRVIQVAQPQAIRRQLAAGAALRSVAPLGVLSVPLAALVWWLVSHFLQPLARLAAELRQRDAASLAPLPTHGLPDETAPLVAALNALLARLDATLAGQRAFLADAAHELRSPLTALKLQLQALQRSTDEVARAQAQAALGEGIARAQRLVEQLLQLARSEADPGSAHQPVDLAALAREVIAAQWPLVQAKGQQLALEGDEAPCVVPGERTALYALLRNLVDNASRYTPPGGRLCVRLAPEPGGVRLSVDDSGPGIPPAERARAFDRFWRRDSGAADGSGLGLAIVQSVARRHGAEPELGTSPEGGLRVSLRLPV